MSVDVPRDPGEIGDADTRVGRPCSFLRLGTPAIHQANWLLAGSGTPRFWSVCQGISTGSSPVYHARAHRHPNCDYLDVAMLIRCNIIQTSSAVTVKAGTGAARTLQLSAIGDYVGWYLIRAPWAVGDSGVENVVVSCHNLSLAGMLAYDCPRMELESGDDRIEHQDQDGPYPGCGIVEGWWLTTSVTAGTRALIQEVIDAWDDLKPTLLSWPGATADALSVAAGGGWLDPFSGAGFEARARRKRASETRRAVDWHAYVKTSSAAGSFHLLVSSANPGPGADDAVTSGVLSSAAWGWVVLTSCQVDCTTDAQISVRIDATGASAYIAALFGIEH